MTAKAQETRRQINEEKDLKLRSPNFVVSRTRLCLHNLPAAVDEKALRQHVTKAVRLRLSPSTRSDNRSLARSLRASACDSRS